MDPNLKIVIILTMGFSFASLFAYIAQRLKLPSLLGYLLAGFLIGPYSPGFVADIAISEQLAEIGVILMLFGVGLHFKLQDLYLIKHIAIIGAALQTAIATLLTTLFLYEMGWPLEAGLIVGLSIGVASTVVLVRVLSDNHLLNSPEGHIAIGWLVVEDFFTVIVLILLPTLGSGAALSPLTITTSVIMALLKFLVLVVFMFTWGQRALSYILTPIARLRSHELFTITVLALVFLIAAGSSLIFGTSIALGAFIAGMAVGMTSVRHQAAANALPLKDIFTIIFFLSVGMLFNPEAIVDNFTTFLVVLSIILLAKPLAAYLITLAFGYPLKVALTLAISLAQIGEFSFILAEESLKWHLLPEDGYDIIVACAFVSISLNPILFQLLRFYDTAIQKFSSKKNPQTSKIPSKAVIVGFGVIGKETKSILKQAGIRPIIVEHNIDTALSNEEKEAVIFGDASQADILKQAFVEEAAHLFITLPETAKTMNIIRQARQLNPSIHIVAIAHYLQEKGRMDSLKVDYVCTEEEALKAYRAYVLRALSAHHIEGDRKADR